MKTIIIIRHAKSSWDKPGLSDFDRSLDKRGLRDGPIMALRLKDAGYQPEHIVSSSAVRAKTTAAFFADRFNIPLDLSDNLYHGLPEDYLEAIRSESENIDCMALFGHNPGITYLANMIQPGCTDNIPTCGIIIAASDLKSWEDLSWQNIQLQALMFPKSTGHE